MTMHHDFSGDTWAASNLSCISNEKWVINGLVLLEEADTKIMHIMYGKET